MTARLFHHVELWVPDLPSAKASWGPVMAALGCEPFQDWENGCSWRLGDSYLVVERSPAMVSESPYDRMRAGLNHLAVWGNRSAVEVALSNGWTQRVDTGDAVHVINPDGFELEIRLDG